MSRFSIPCDERRIILALWTRPDGRERLFEKADNIFFMASVKTGIVSTVFLRIMLHLFFRYKEHYAPIKTKSKDLFTCNCAKLY